MGEPRFVACTPFGIMKLIEEAGLPLAGADAVVVGRSNIVGKPMAALLIAADATVTVCHSRTRDLAAVVGRADVLVAAVGRAEMIRGAWIKPGAVVIDVGINRVAERQAGRRRRVRRRRRARVGDHPGARRRRPDDHRDAAVEHAALRPRPRALTTPGAPLRPRALQRTAVGLAMQRMTALCSSANSGRVGDHLVGAALMRAHAIALQLPERDDRRRRRALVEAQRLDQLRPLGARRVEIDHREVDVVRQPLGPRAEVDVDDRHARIDRR